MWSTVARTLQGHLKEQDGLIQFLIDLHKTHTPEEVMAKMERWIREHRQRPRGSTLSQLIPTIGEFWTHLNLVRPPAPSPGPSPHTTTGRSRVGMTGTPTHTRRETHSGSRPISDRCRVTHAAHHSRSCPTLDIAAPPPPAVGSHGNRRLFRPLPPLVPPRTR